MADTLDSGLGAGDFSADDWLGLPPMHFDSGDSPAAGDSPATGDASHSGDADASAEAFASPGETGPAADEALLPEAAWHTVDWQQDEQHPPAGDAPVGDELGSLTLTLDLPDTDTDPGAAAEPEEFVEFAEILERLNVNVEAEIDKLTAEQAADVARTLFHAGVVEVVVDWSVLDTVSGD